MSDDVRMRNTPRAGPVAGLPLDALLERCDDLARRWAIALVLAQPMGRLGDVPLEDLAREAPGLCGELLRALESDAELERLTGARDSGREDSAPARRLPIVSGASDAGVLAHAVEALRGVLWEALLEELPRPLFEQSYSHRVADLSDRLAYVCASALAAALAADAPGGATPAEAEATPTDAGPRLAEDDLPLARGRREPVLRRAVIVDEREPPPAPPGASAEIEIRDERGEAGPVAWIGSIGRQLERFRRDALPFAVLLVELRDLDGLSRAGRPHESPRLADEVEQTLASELSAAADGGEPGPLPWSGSLTRERPGRYWLLAPETDRSEARMLAERLIGAVRRHAGDRGIDLEVAVGAAACPDDGREAAELAAHADLELYAARASARPTAGRPPAVDEPA